MASHRRPAREELIFKMMNQTLLVKRIISYTYTINYEDDRNPIPPDETIETMIGGRRIHLKRRPTLGEVAYLITRRTSLLFTAVFAYTLLQMNMTSRIWKNLQDKGFSIASRKLSL